MNFNQKTLSKGLRKIVLVCWLLLAGVWTAHGQHTVDGLRLMAAENNAGLKSAFNTYLAAMEQIPQAGVLPDPQVAFGLFVRPVETRLGTQRATVAISQAFPWFGTRRVQSGIATNQAEAAFLVFEKERLLLDRNVKLTCNAYFLLEKLTFLTEENLSFLASLKELAMIRFESGEGSFADVLKVEMEENVLRNQWQTFEERKNLVWVRLGNLVNQPLEGTLEQTDSLDTFASFPDKQQVWEHVLAENPELKMLDYQLQAQSGQVALARQMARPSFTIGATYINISPSDMAVSNNGADALVLPQVGLRLPIYQKKYTAMGNQAGLMEESLHQQKQEKAFGLSSQYEKVLQEYSEAIRGMELNQQLSDLAEKMLRLEQTGFATGEADFDDVLDWKRKQLTYRLELEKAKTKARDSLYEIQFLTGR